MGGVGKLYDRAVHFSHLTYKDSTVSFLFRFLLKCSCRHDQFHSTPQGLWDNNPAPLSTANVLSLQNFCLFPPHGFFISFAPSAYALKRTGCTLSSTDLSVHLCNVFVLVLLQSLRFQLHSALERAKDFYPPRGYRLPFCAEALRLSKFFLRQCLSF